MHVSSAGLRSGGFSRKRSLVAASLQLLPVLVPAASLVTPFPLWLLGPILYLGGFGYLFLGRWRRFLAVAFGYSGLLVAAVLVALASPAPSIFRIHLVVLLWTSIVCVVSLFCALDAWYLAQRRPDVSADAVEAAGPTPTRRTPRWSTILSVLGGVWVLVLVQLIFLVFLELTVGCIASAVNCP